MKRILIAGAGKSSSSLISYMLQHSVANNWQITVMDSNLDAINDKIANHPNAKAEVVDIKDEQARKKLVAAADIILSVMPPHLHFLLAQDCLSLGKHLITSSYVSDDIKSLNEAASNKQLLFMCEMGCDPGIDHMSTAKIFDEIHAKNNVITEFRSFCGGLVAPQSDDNLWHYKISWNPHNIVTAAQKGAVWLEDNQVISRNHDAIFSNPQPFKIDGLTNLVAYPNRDSLSYKDIFNVPSIRTFERATLRHENFMHGWSKIVDLQLTSESISHYESGASFKQWIAKAANTTTEQLNETLKNNYGFEELTFQLFEELNLLSDNTIPATQNNLTNALILQAVIEQHWKLEEEDKDMIVMQHLVTYENEAETIEHESSLIVIGDDRLQTAMAKTVGLPMAILAHLILDNKIDTAKINGVKIPIDKEIYEQVLPLLEQEGIKFTTKEKSIA